MLTRSGSGAPGFVTWACPCGCGRPSAVTFVKATFSRFNEGYTPRPRVRLFIPSPRQHFASLVGCGLSVSIRHAFLTNKAVFVCSPLTVQWGYPGAMGCPFSRLRLSLGLPITTISTEKPADSGRELPAAKSSPGRTATGHSPLAPDPQGAAFYSAPSFTGFSLLASSPVAFAGSNSATSNPTFPYSAVATGSPVGSMSALPDSG